MHKQTLEKNTERVFATIAQSGVINNFYLAGRTALALELGHRKSEDLDWFSSSPFFGETIKKKLSELGELELTSEEDGTIHGLLDGVKVSFLRYDYGMLFPFIRFENANLADERDIAGMKIDAMSSRGSKKDFIDIYFLLEKYPLFELIGFFEKKYRNIQFNKLHIFKSLVFFEDAEAEPMPVMIREVDWEAVKQKIQTATNSILGSQS
ncbi:MAG: nucleotidyl transferase AbiEii/AbiGii toxin family protein [Candidatus Wildermuthbacteria bacterium]|nr:nucleotidyl transferase AbiEii/AbiGii toxin family protein [Candidatus Wildermuthbacteria bacterium]